MIAYITHTNISFIPIIGIRLLSVYLFYIIMYVKTDDGRTLYVDARVTGNKPVALFLHGYLENGRIWGGAVRAIQDSCDYIVIDMRGYGYSKTFDILLSDLSTLRYARDINNVLNALKVSSLKFAVGHSFGGVVLQRWIGEYNKTGGVCKKIILLNTSIKTPTKIKSLLDPKNFKYAAMLDLQRSAVRNVIKASSYDTRYFTRSQFTSYWANLLSASAPNLYDFVLSRRACDLYDFLKYDLANVATNISGMQVAYAYSDNDEIINTDEATLLDSCYARNTNITFTTTGLSNAGHVTMHRSDVLDMIRYAALS
jgi:pimeloyl-ACP methyl ester carboxylesterase